MMELLISVCLLGLLTVTMYRFGQRNLKVDEDFYRANQQKDMHIALVKMTDDLKRASDMVKMKEDSIEVAGECSFTFCSEALMPESGIVKPIYFFSICHPHTAGAIDPPKPLLYAGEGSRVLVAAVLSARQTVNGHTVGQIDYVRTKNVNHPVLGNFPVSPGATGADFLLRPLPEGTEIELNGKKPLLDLVSKIQIVEISSDPVLIGISIECSPEGEASSVRTTLNERISIPLNVKTERF